MIWISCPAAQFDQWTVYPATSPLEVAERIADAEVIITNKVQINAQHMQHNPQLKVILISATGTNNVDLNSDVSKALWCVIVRDMALPQ